MGATQGLVCKFDGVGLSLYQVCKCSHVDTQVHAHVFLGRIFLVGVEYTDIVQPCNGCGEDGVGLIMVENKETYAPIK